MIEFHHHESFCSRHTSHTAPLTTHVRSSNAPLLLHKLTASFFDSDERVFFGRTFESVETPLDFDHKLMRSPQLAINVRHNLDVFTHSPLIGPR